MNRVDVDLHLHLIAPPAIKLHLLPRLLNVDLENMRIDLAHADGVNGEDLAEN